VATLEKGSFPSQRQLKLSLREDGSFQVFQKINNAYKSYPLSKYGVSLSFNICDLTPFAKTAGIRMI